MIDYYEAEVISANDYYPFGMMMPGRKFSADGSYRYGFNGKEQDQETTGTTTYDYGFRIYNPALGKFLSVDPLTHKFAWQSSYVAFNNNPIFLTDPDGRAAAPPSTDVTKNQDGSYTVVNAKNDCDNNVYVVDNEGKRTGEVIATTLQPFDFMYTDDNTGEFKFQCDFGGLGKITFRLDQLKVSGTIHPNEHTKEMRKNLDLNGLLDWVTKTFRKEVERQSPATSYGQLEILRHMSANYQEETSKSGMGSLDIKASLGLHPYTPIKHSDGLGMPTITTLRAAGNIAFGKNMRSTKPALLTESFYYKTVMKKVGEYNQNHNGGNGYNKGFPYYGEHTYSGSYIYLGYFGKYIK